MELHFGEASLYRHIHTHTCTHTHTHTHTQGYRTLDDLRQSGILNRQQLIGIKHYDEFIERMQRSEVEEIEAKVHTLSPPWPGCGLHFLNRNLNGC